MQIDNQTSSLLNLTPGGLTGRPVSVGKPTDTEPVNSATSSGQRPAGFPDAPRISSQPLRYNVQLNDQLTSVQQAENFLQSTEMQLLKLCNLVSRHARPDDVKTQARQLKSVLHQRQTLSAGTVDRQMKVALTGKTQINFGLRNSEGLVSSGNSETLMFSLAGNRRELSAVVLGQNSNSNTALLRLNQALGQWGIHGKMDQQQVKFSVEEPQWARVQQHLSVQGEGERFPKGQFVPLRPQAEVSLEDVVAAIEADPTTASNRLPALQRSLEAITRQRSQLKISRASVRHCIDGMVAFTAQGRAATTSERLRETLGNARSRYAVLATAIGAQANVHATVVRNVLSN